MNLEKNGKKSVSMANPVMNKLSKAQEVFTFEEKTETATYTGIAKKTGFFLLATIIGVVVYFMMHNYLLNVGSADSIIQFTDGMYYDVEMHVYEVFILLGVLLATFILPFIAIFIVRTIPVVGTIYAVAEGYVIGCIANWLSDQYKFAGELAIVITITIVAAMLFLYAKRIIRVTEKFRSVLTTVVLTIVLGSLLLFIFSFIPGLKEISKSFGFIMANPLVSIAGSIVFIVIAAMFLLSDFDMMEQCVENKMPKKYEWVAAFGFVYTVIYLYFRVLELILKIAAYMNDGKN